MPAPPPRAGALRRQDGGARGLGAEEGTIPSAVGGVSSPCFGRCLPGPLLPLTLGAGSVPAARPQQRGAGGPQPVRAAPHRRCSSSQAFTELQAKVIDTQQKVKLADIQIEQLSKTKKHAHLTDTEVMMLVDETRMYEGVGRM